jgi:hypothetical protein
VAREVLSAQGWPGWTLAGANDAAAAWLLAQHADRDPVRRRAFLDALRGAVGQGLPVRRIWPTRRPGRRPACAVRDVLITPLVRHDAIHVAPLRRALP